MEKGIIEYTNDVISYKSGNQLKTDEHGNKYLTLVDSSKKIMVIGGGNGFHIYGKNYFEVGNHLTSDFGNHLTSDFGNGNGNDNNTNWNIPDFWINLNTFLGDKKFKAIIIDNGSESYLPSSNTDLESELIDKIAICFKNHIDQKGIILIEGPLAAWNNKYEGFSKLIFDKLINLSFNRIGIIWFNDKINLDNFSSILSLSTSVTILKDTTNINLPNYDVGYTNTANRVFMFNSLGNHVTESNQIKFINNRVINNRDITEQEILIGRFITPQLLHLRESIRERKGNVSMISIKHQLYSQDPNPIMSYKIHIENSGSNIQVFSKCNCLFSEINESNNILNLQIVSPSVESAIACAGGTLYRYHFVPIVDESGNLQYGSNQHVEINLFDEFRSQLFNITNEDFFIIENGYLNFIPNEINDSLKSNQQAEKLNAILKILNSTQLDQLRDSIKIGINQNVQVICKNNNELIDEDITSEKFRLSPIVTQLICFDAFFYIKDIKDCYQLLQLILDANYEATLLGAIVYPPTMGNKQHYVYLDGYKYSRLPEDLTLEEIQEIQQMHHNAIVRAINIVKPYNPDLYIIINYFNNYPIINYFIPDITNYKDDETISFDSIEKEVQATVDGSY